MSQAFFSFLTGLCYTGGMFLICLFTVVGAKTFLSGLSVKKSERKRTPKKPAPEPAKKEEAKPRPVKSIEINPDEIDRIYVKKSG